MARQKKIGLENFPLDVDILSDVKVMKLIHRYGDSTAFSIFVALLCRIYKEGYYIKYEEDDTAFHLSVILHERDEHMIDTVIEGCLEIGLFDRNMFERYRVLTSAAIQRRYIAIQQSSRRVCGITQYKCESSEDSRISSEDSRISSEDSHVSSEETPVITEGNRNFSEETKIFSEEKPVIADLIGRNLQETDILPKKETKEKVPKKKNKEKNPPTTSTTAPAPTREDGSEQGSSVIPEVNAGELFPSETPTLESFGNYIQELRRSQSWKEMVCMKYHLHDMATLEKFIDEFALDCVIRDKLAHYNSSDMKQHFVNWLNIKHRSSHVTDLTSNSPASCQQRRDEAYRLVAEVLATNEPVLPYQRADHK